jgi:hypothetical protein
MEQGGSSAASTSPIGGSTSTTTGATATATVTAGGKKPMDTRLVYGLGVGVPTALLAWAIADENSPPAKFAKIIGVTGQWDEFADQFARPVREKLLPDWPVSAVLYMECMILVLVSCINLAIVGIIIVAS